MQKSNKNPAHVEATLLEMGYPQEMIALALKESKNKSLERILDSLVNNEAEYKAILENSKPLKVVSDPSNVEVTAKKRKNSNKKEERHKKADNKNAQDVNDAIRKGSKSSENYSVEESDDEIPKSLDAESLDYIGSAVQSLRMKARDSNWYIIELSYQLKSLNFKTNEGATRVRYYLDLPAQYSRLEEYKKLVYRMLCEILNTKVNKKFRTNYGELEVVLALAFELNLLSPAQMGNVLTLYPKFFAKHMRKMNEEVLAKLEECYKKVKGTENDVPEENPPDEDPEEEKLEEANDDVTDELQAELINIDGKEKEYCIICMQKVREIVFMPCCHFLTCQLCSVRIGKCPVCNNKVHKHLQIFWS